MARGSDGAVVEAVVACVRPAGSIQGRSKVRESGRLATATGGFASVSRWRHRWAPSCLVMPVAEACQSRADLPSPCRLPFSLAPCEQILLHPLVAPFLFHFGVNSFSSLQSCHSAVVNSGPGLLLVFAFRSARRSCSNSAEQYPVHVPQRRSGSGLEAAVRRLVGGRVQFVRERAAGTGQGMTTWDSYRVGSTCRHTSKQMTFESNGRSWRW